MAGLIDTGINYRKQANAALGQAARGANEVANFNRKMDAADKAGKWNAAGQGLGMGFMSYESGLLGKGAAKLGMSKPIVDALTPTPPEAPVPTPGATPTPPAGTTPAPTPGATPAPTPTPAPAPAAESVTAPTSETLTAPAADTVAAPAAEGAAGSSGVAAGLADVGYAIGNVAGAGYSWLAALLL